MKLLIRLVITAAILAHAHGVNARDCEVLKVKYAKTVPIYEYIWKSGDFCIDQSLSQSTIYSGRTFRRITKHGAAFSISHSNVLLDLKGYSVVSHSMARTGVVIDRDIDYTKKEHARDFPVHHVKIRNGTIDVGGGEPAIALPTITRLINLVADYDDRVAPWDPPVLAEVRARGVKNVLDRKRYPDSHVNYANSVESMSLKASNVTVRILGRDTRIIGNKIEGSKGWAALYLRGASPVIENNIIIFNGLGRTESSAPIRLFQADNAIIRNNIIILEDARYSPEQAISLIRSANVTMEGNRIFGGRKIVRTFDDQSSTVAKDNILRPYAERPLITTDMKAATEVDLSVRWIDTFPFAEEDAEISF